MFGVTAILALLSCGPLFIVPESPRWLAKNGQPERARRVVVLIGGEVFAQKELDEVEETLANEVARVDFRELLDPKLMPILGLGMFLAIFQQWCGINVVFNDAQ